MKKYKYENTGEGAKVEENWRKMHLQTCMKTYEEENWGFMKNKRKKLGLIFNFCSRV